MTVERMLTQIRFCMFLGNGFKRTAYAKKKQVFAEIGNVVQLPMAIPLYPKLVKIHNNVIMHHSVKLVTHDYMNAFLKRIPGSYQFKHEEAASPIEIMDNVYIGMNVIILGNVRIGPNAVINAGSVVVSDVPPNSVVAGVPAKAIGSFDMLVKSRAMADKMSKMDFSRYKKEAIDDETVQKAWDLFDQKKNRPVRDNKPIQKQLQETTD